MPRQSFYHAAEHVAPHASADPYLSAAFPFSNRLRRLLWNACWLVFYRPSPRPLHRWRAMLLRLFGSTLGPNCHFYPASKVHSPWNLSCADAVAAGDGVEIYNPAPMRLGSHVILSQGAYLCGATHDYDNPAFPLLTYEMEVGAYAWICARACVSPGVKIGEGAVLGLASVATKDLEPWTVYAGAPAVRIKSRKHHE